jgi:hypothetical protein
MRRQTEAGPDEEWLTSLGDSNAGLVGLGASRYDLAGVAVDVAGSSAACPGACSEALVMHADSPCASIAPVNPAPRNSPSAAAARGWVPVTTSQEEREQSRAAPALLDREPVGGGSPEPPTLIRESCNSHPPMVA